MRVTKSEYPDLNQEASIFMEHDLNKPFTSRAEAMEKCLTRIKGDAAYILYLKKMKKELGQNFEEYVKERLRIERESARELNDPEKANIRTSKDVETRLCYIEQFIDVVNPTLTYR